MRSLSQVCFHIGKWGFDLNKDIWFGNLMHQDEQLDVALTLLIVMKNRAIENPDYNFEDMYLTDFTMLIFEPYYNKSRLTVRSL